MQIDIKIVQHVIGRRKKNPTETYQIKQFSSSTDVDNDVARKNVEEITFQEEERKRRAANIIVHGLHEEPKKSDDEAAKRFLKSLDMDINPKSAARLGEKEARGNPPPENYH